MFTWLNGTELALHIRGLGFESRQLHFYFYFLNFIILLGTQTNRADMSASAELLVFTAHSVMLI